MSTHLDTKEATNLGGGKAAQVLARFREYVVGPTRFMNLLSCFELGIMDVLQKNPGSGLTAAQIGAEVGVGADAVEQLLHLMVKEDFVSYEEASAAYTLDGLSHLSADDFDRVLPWMNMVKAVCLRQVYYLSESVRSGTPVGLKEFYGFDGILYEANAEHEDLREAWGTMMDQVTSFIDPWFFHNIGIPADAKVLDLAGNTGLGAILAYRFKPAQRIHVTCFDFPEKEEAALRNFRDQGVQDHCSFFGGDVFKGLPKGYDAVMIKHFLDMFDKEPVFDILRAVHDALDPGGQVHVLVPIYPEDVKSSYAVDILPAYFLGCTMGQGGPQKISTYQRWLEECGFEVTKAISEDISKMPPDVIPQHGILSATKVSR